MTSFWFGAESAERQLFFFRDYADYIAVTFPDQTTRLATVSLKTKQELPSELHERPGFSFLP